MKRIAIVADSHFDEHSRFEECQSLHAWIANDIAMRGVDLLLHAGDLFERKANLNERFAAALWLQSVANVCPVVIVRGNHDVLGELPIFEKLRAKHPIKVVEGAEVVNVADVQVAALAWPRKAALLDAVNSHEASEVLANDALRSVLRGFSQSWISGSSAPRILLAHAMVRGSMTSLGQPLVGCDLEVGTEDLSLAKAGFYALGHIHKGQAFESLDGAAIVYPGSPRRTAFGELEEKGYVIVEFDDSVCGCPQGFVRGRCAVCANLGSYDWENIVAPATEMFLLEDEWGYDASLNQDGWLCGCHGMPASVLDAEIRFRYHVAADRRMAARAAAIELVAELSRAGAKSVKLEERVRPVMRAPSAHFAIARSLKEKLLAFWESRGIAPDERRQAAILSKLDEVEEETRQAAA